MNGITKYKEVIFYSVVTAILITPSSLFSKISYAFSMSLRAKRWVISGVVKLYQYAVTMINFVMDYLCRETRECFDTCLKFSRLPLHFYCLITLTLSGSAEQRKTAFFCIVGPRLFYTIASAGAFSGSQPVKPSSGIALITAISSAESSKSKICAFSIILAGVTDFVSTLRPDCKTNLRHI